MSAVEAVQEDEPNAWWTTLKHQGVLLSPIILEEIFPDGPPEIGEREYESLRRSYKSFRNDPDELYDWLDVVLEDLLGHSKSWWVKETNVPAEFRRGDLRPNRVLLDEKDEARAMVWIDTERVTDDDGEPGRIGIYSGKRTYAKLVRLLRETGTEIGILTNGHQFRVIHATLDHESWTEWDAQAWFQGGEGRRALRGYYGLLSDDVLPAPTEDEEESLLGRVKASRDRQADLSDVMGTQVREAVELLLKDLDAILMEMSEEEREEILAPLSERDLGRRDELRSRYQAAIRIVMRLVVALYAESRELFPKDNPVYYNSYSVEGLFRDLREARIEEGEDTLEKQFSAWPRLQALSRLVYYGSPHSDVPLRAYGGRLFRPPGEDGDDDVLAGLEVFENDAIRLSDATILEVLEKLKIAEFKSGGQRRTGPVDFSDLRTEYIGMMYEGLLDYELREATEDDGAILFLNIGDQPALPFNVLENLDDDGLEKLVDNLKDNASDSFLADEEVSEEDFDEGELDEDEETADEGEDVEDELEGFDDDLEARVHQWAKRVVEETGVYMPHFNTVRAMDPTTREKYENKAASRVVDRIIRPGGTYLVSHSGTRKSTGTFYTPPGLAVPTVHRTLEPLAYEENGDTKVPKKPEEILDLQICDPAMGSGTFPVAALRYLTDALKESFEEHVFPEVDVGDPIAAPLGDTAKGYLNERLFEIRKGENEDWQDRLEMQLKRSVVERCIYGVDINPLAVELGKLSLWIETLDPKLPFTFLDHKLRVGNSLVGAWLDEFEHYPVAAWNREGGDGRKGDRTKRIKNFRNGELKEQMQTYIRENLNETHWFEPDSTEEITDLLKEARKAFEQLHESIDEAEREQLYHKEFQENEDIRTLRYLMDKWCAVWFWPLDSDNSPVLDPDSFYDTDEDADIKSIVHELSNHRELQFFHWELEFPDVFHRESNGFDATIGNPPWETVETKSLEFFSRYIPEYRTYTKRDARKKREQLFDSQPDVENRWYRYVEIKEGLKNFVKYSSDPWDVPLARGTKSKDLAESWKEIREDGSNIKKPYRYQGTGRVNTYKLFAEKAHYLTNGTGRIGMLFPDGIYNDFGSQDLRKLYLEQSSWEWLFGFENKNRIFDIHRQFKFCTTIIQKGEQTDVLHCQFMVLDPDDWSTHDPSHVNLNKSQILEFSPETRSIVEIDDQQDAELLEKIYSNSQTLSEAGVEYDQGEFNLSSDASLFSKLSDWDDEYVAEACGLRWSNGDDEARPVYEGRMVGILDSAEKGHVKGHGRSAKWRDVPFENKQIEPQYLMSMDNWLDETRALLGPSIAIMDVTSATNSRTTIATLSPACPHGHKTPLLRVEDQDPKETLVSLGVLTSYAYDYVQRFRISGNSLIWGVLETSPIPNSDRFPEVKESILWRVASLLAPCEFLAPDIIAAEPTRYEPATKEGDRKILIAELNALVAWSYGLSQKDMEWILRPDEDVRRGFWRVDKSLSKEAREPELIKDAHQHLEKVGITEFDENRWSPPTSVLDTYQFSSDVSGISTKIENELMKAVQQVLTPTQQELFEEFLEGSIEYSEVWTSQAIRGNQ